MSKDILSQYKAIIFDWDGTLVDSTDWVLGAHNFVRSEMGKKLWTMDDIFGSSSYSASELYPQIYGDDADKAMSLLLGYVRKNNLESSEPYAEAEDLLKFLTDQKIPLGVVSNKRHEPLNEVVDYLGWREYFSVTIGAGFAKRDKPHPSSLYMAIAKVNEVLIPADILYVGDTETDLQTAQNAGCPVALIQSDKPRPDLVEKYSPNYVYRNLQDFYMAVTKG